MTDLSNFGGGSSATESDASDRSDGASIGEYCVAVKDNGERCKNAVSHMHGEPVCGPHKRALPVEGVCWNPACETAVEWCEGAHEAYCSDTCAVAARDGGRGR